MFKKKKSVDQTNKDLEEYVKNSYGTITVGIGPTGPPQPGTVVSCDNSTSAYADALGYYKILQQQMVAQTGLPQTYYGTSTSTVSATGYTYSYSAWDELRYAASSPQPKPKMETDPKLYEALDVFFDEKRKREGAPEVS